MIEGTNFPTSTAGLDTSGDEDLQQRLHQEILLDIAHIHYEQVILVDKVNGNALFLHSMDTAFSREVSEELFPFDETIHNYLEKYCTDLEPEKVIEKTSLAHVLEELEHKDHYTVYFNLSSQNRFAHKRIIWQQPSRLPNYLCAVIEDLSGAFLYEDQRSSQLKRALAEAQVNLDANNTFLTLISRDIRTPLHSIIGLSQIANAELKDISAVESYLHKISMSGTYMEKTIDDIRDFIRISWHPIELREEHIDLKQFTKLAAGAFISQAEERQLHFTYRTEGLQVSQIIGDSSALRQVIVKLTDNVLNYTLRGGSVELSINSAKAGDGMVKVSLQVQSRGIDLDQSRVSILKEPYEYVMSEVRRSISSIDMNLVILRAYLNAMDGTVDIETERGIRTSLTVTLEFPEGSSDKVPAVPKRVPASQHKNCSFQGKHALLADDDTINLEVGTKLLENTGMVVFTAKNGLEAINLFTAENGNFDVILMDIRMPVMNGLEASRTIRELSLPTARTVPIIAMTVNAFDEDIQQSMRAGMNEHLVKPIEPQLLLRVLSEVLKVDKAED